MEYNYIAFGDIHGMLEEFTDLYNQIDIKENDILVFLGDYIDRGPNSKGVIDALMKMKENHNCIFLRGNHEDMFLKAEDDYKYMRCWLLNGGGQTLKSFNCEYYMQIPRDYIKWIKNNTILAYQPDNTNILFVHAGINPDYPLSEQSEDDVMWIRDKFLKSEKNFGVKVIHGHSPCIYGIEEKHNRINIDTGSCLGGYISAARISPKGDILDKFSVKCWDIKNE